MSLSINKNGVITTQLFSEYIANTYDTEYYVEPDNSVWIRIFHHNNPNASGNLFASTDTFTSQVYKKADMWFNVALCNYLSDSWELMIKQALTSGGTVEKYRWVQSYNPMTATFDQTKTANVTFNTSSEYTTPGSAYGGVFKSTTNKTYLSANTNDAGNWWGAIGCWTAYNSGIPGYNGKTITTGYMDLYLRINTHPSKASFGNNYIQSNEIIEI